MTAGSLHCTTPFFISWRLGGARISSKQGLLDGLRGDGVLDPWVWDMTVVRVANIVVVLVMAWAVWERRLTFQSRYDFPNTAAVALFGLGAALDSPWPAVSAASHALTGHYYAFMVLGHFCYMAGAAMGIKSVYMRLMPDDAIGPFLRRRIVLPILGAAAIMVISFAASPATSSLSVDHLYLASPDRWLTIYWVVHFGTITWLGIVVSYGVSRLRGDPRSVMLNPMLVSLVLAALAGVVIAVGLVLGHGQDVRIVGWLVVYGSFIGGAVSSALQWRHRVQSLLRPSER